MFTPDLMPIASTSGDNLGGICYFDCCPRQWLADEVIINPITRTVETALVLIEGKTMLRFEMLEDSTPFSEDRKRGKSGYYYEQKLGGIINKDEASKSINMDTLGMHDLVVIYTDHNGLQKIIGNKEMGMQLLHAVDVEKDVSGKTMYTIELTHQTEHACPFYNPA